MNIKKWIKLTLGFFLVIAILFGGLLTFLTMAEYRPALIEPLTVFGKSEKNITFEDEIDLLSWNVGYFALGEKADFFMDGGKTVRGISEEDVRFNMNAIIEELKKHNPDMVLLQEIDKDSSRSYHVDEVNALLSAFPEAESSYANNYKCVYVPYPFPTLGKVDAGVLSLLNYAVKSSERVSLPSPFKWPVKTVNLKRCLLIQRLPIEGSEKELIIINLHLEAYDDGEGKIAQFHSLINTIKTEYERGNYVIAGGDFNQSFSKISLENFPVKGENVWRPGLMELGEEEEYVTALMDYKIPSCRSLECPYEKSEEGFNYYVIDGFLVSKNIEILDFQTISLDFKHSDHNPITLKVKLKR